MKKIAQSSKKTKFKKLRGRTHNSVRGKINPNSYNPIGGLLSWCYVRERIN